jgi:hypothetical protein
MVNLADKMKPRLQRCEAGLPFASIKDKMTQAFGEENCNRLEL